jgi:hypothetical protein
MGCSLEIIKVTVKFISTVLNINSAALFSKMPDRNTKYLRNSFYCCTWTGLLIRVTAFTHRHFHTEYTTGNQ